MNEVYAQALRRPQAGPLDGGGGRAAAGRAGRDRRRRDTSSRERVPPLGGGSGLVVRPVFKTAMEAPTAAPVGSIPTRSRHCWDPGAARSGCPAAHMAVAPETAHIPSTVTTLLLVNPTAGRGRAGRLAPEADSALPNERGARSRRIETTAPGAAVEQVRQAVEAGAERIVVLGGDGTLHEAANGLLRATVRSGRRSRSCRRAPATTTPRWRGPSATADPRGGAPAGTGHGAPVRRGRRLGRVLPQLGRASASTPRWPGW